MINFVSYLVANSYGAGVPILNVGGAVCKINGEIVPCNSGLAGGIFAFFAFYWIIFFAIMFLVIVSNWKIYTKAGRPGWASIIPVYNLVVLMEIVKKPTWWVLLLFIPFVNFIVMLVVISKLSRAFGHGTGYFFGLIFLPFIFYPLLAFGKSTYLLSGMVQGSSTPPAPQATL